MDPLWACFWLSFFILSNSIFKNVIGNEYNTQQNIAFQENCDLWFPLLNPDVCQKVPKPSCVRSLPNVNLRSPSSFSDHNLWTNDRIKLFYTEFSVGVVIFNFFVSALEQPEKRFQNDPLPNYNFTQVLWREKVFFKLLHRKFRKLLYSVGEIKTIGAFVGLSTEICKILSGYFGVQLLPPSPPQKHVLTAFQNITHLIHLML